MDLATVLGVVATLAFLARLIPQPLKLARTGVPDGVSVLMAMNIALTELAWFFHGIANGLVPVWLVSLPAFPIAVWTVVLLRHQIRLVDVAAASAWLAVIVASALAGQLGLVVAVSVFVQYGPQVWTAVRQSDLAGISPGMWKLAVVDALTWGAYGAVVGDPSLMGYAFVLSTFAVVILVRIWQTQGTLREDGRLLAAAPDTA